MMIFFLLAVHCLTPVSFLEKVAVEGPIENLAVHLGISITLIADYFKECGASRSRLSQHKHHLSRLCDALEIFQDIKLPPLLSKTQKGLERLVHIEKGYKSVGECLRRALASAATCKTWC